MRYTPDTSGMDSRLKKNLEDISRVLAKQGATPPATSNQASSGSAAGMTLASSVIVAPAGGIASTNVQSALQELDTEKLSTTATIDAIAQGTTSKKLSATEYTDLTDAGDSTLHYHASDRNRANHTGTQTASTISDFASTVRGVVLTGLSLATGGLISVADSILGALGKLQNQLTTLTATVNSKQDANFYTVSGSYSATGSWLRLINVVLPSANTNADWTLSIFNSGSLGARARQNGQLRLSWRDGVLDAEYVQFTGIGATYLSFGYKGSIASGGTLQVYAITGDATPSISMRVDKSYGGFEGNANAWATTNPTITTNISTKNLSDFETNDSRYLRLSGVLEQTIEGTVNTQNLNAGSLGAARVTFSSVSVSTTSTVDVTDHSSILVTGSGIIVTLSGGYGGQMVVCRVAGTIGARILYSGEGGSSTVTIDNCHCVLFMCTNQGKFARVF